MCGLLLQVKEEVRTVLAAWWTACHRVAVILSTQSRNHFQCLRSVLRKTALVRRELTAAIFGPTGGGATQWVAVSQVVDSALQQSDDKDWAQGNQFGGPTPAETDQERMENSFKHVKDFVRSGAHGG